jgi:dTDP-4-amino-4,6-dideoxygalactose transaminase
MAAQLFKSPRHSILIERRCLMHTFCRGARVARAESAGNNADMEETDRLPPAIARLCETLAFPDPVYVTRPVMPDLGAYTASLEKIWEKRWLTNRGDYHEALEKALCEYLGVEHLSLFCNGTIALLVALQALGIDGGEVITTPFTFPATVHVLHWNRVQPVFADIDSATFNLDPERVEAAITPDTRAVMPVHVYGTPCDTDAFDAIGRRHGLPVVYDAAHAFGVQYRGGALALAGDLSVLSFHATKFFTTGEGGAVVARTAAEKERIDFLKNFGIAGEETVIGPGINGKMNEFQAAFGLLQLGEVAGEIANRRRVAAIYRDRLAGVDGLTLPPAPSDTEPNHAYFPVRIDAARFGLSRDELYTLLRRFNVIARKYFYPLCSKFPPYADLPSAREANLPEAEKTAREVLCLPVYGSLRDEDVDRIAEIILRIRDCFRGGHEGHRTP